MNPSKGPFRRGFVEASYLVALVCAILHQSAEAQPADAPLEDFVATDGFVYAITETNKVLYFGGLFSSVGLRTGGGVPVSALTGQPESPFPKINGNVNAAVADGQGG
jgi:hypothetical protein